MGDYALASIFAVRSAGVAFDVLEKLGAPAVLEAARALNAFEDEIARVADRMLAQLATETVERNVKKKLAEKLERRTLMSADRIAAHPWLAPYAEAHAAHASATAVLDEMIAREYGSLLQIIAREAKRALPDFVLLEAGELVDEIEALAKLDGARNTSQDRRRHRTIAMYLQRACAKNDTFSRFGPIAWGTVVAGDGVVARPRPGFARRVELEAWVISSLVDLIDADPDVRAEIAPRLHPHGRLEPDVFVRLDEEREVPLSASEHALASRCDGETPARDLGDPSVLAQLAERGVIRWKLDVYARDSAPLASLLADIASWRDAAVKERWQARLAPLGVLVERFAADPSIASRRGVFAELRKELERIGIGERDRTRTLYAATNPINENCTIEGEFTIGTGAVERLVADASPWFELWRDSMALAADRIYRRIMEFVAAAPRRGGKLAYSSLARVARAQKFDLEGDIGQSEVGRGVWSEIRREFSAQFASREDAPIWQLTEEDCTFLRRRHDLPPPGELGLPSLDLLVSAASPEDAAAGRFEWVIGESHMAFALLQHATYWRCPDKPTLHAAMRAAVEGAHVVARDAGNAAPVHVSPEAFLEAVGAAYVGTGRPKRGWTVIRPAEAEVIVDEARRDIRLRAPSGEDLGSIVRIPPVPMALHPFFPFVRAPHEPRLQLGNVVVQRRSWYLESSTLVSQHDDGLSARFLARLERTRADRDIPRWVFVRPRPESLTGSYKTRDKDNKPICIDLESLVSLDIFERRLRKYDGMILNEMLPRPDQLIWHAPEGKFVFEMRTNLIRR